MSGKYLLKIMGKTGERKAIYDSFIIKSRRFWVVNKRANAGKPRLVRIFLRAYNIF